MRRTQRLVRGFLIAAALAPCACGGRLDVSRAWSDLERPAAPALPPVDAEPRAALPAPEGLRATSGELREVPLKWDPLLAKEVAGYAVERALDREGPFERIALVAGNASAAFVDRGGDAAPKAGTESGRPADLGDGATYFYRIRALAPSGGLGMDASSVVAVTTAPTPTPPEDLRAYSHQPREVPLTWRAAEDPRVAGYGIYRSPTSRGPFEQLAEVDGRFQTSWVDTGLGDLRVFYYCVAGRNAAGGEGDLSEPVRAVTKPEPLPPAGLRVVDQRLGANRLTWEPNVETDLAGYRLLRLRAGADAPEAVVTLGPDATTAEDPGVAADEEVSYIAITFDHDGLESAPAAPVAVRSAGYDLTAIARRDGVHLEWSPRADGSFRGARVLRVGRFTQTDLGFSESGGFVDREVEPGRRYRYVVVLERPDATRAPPSSPVEIAVPEQ